jgi:hypothetical protein
MKMDDKVDVACGERNGGSNDGVVSQERVMSELVVESDEG